MHAKNFFEYPGVIIILTVAEYSATVLQNPIILKLHILNPELTPKILCETDRILLTILKILYDVPKDIRQSVLKEVMAMDYRSSGNHVFKEFYCLVEEKMKENYGKR